MFHIWRQAALELVLKLACLFIFSEIKNSQTLVNFKRADIKTKIRAVNLAPSGYEYSCIYSVWEYFKINIHRGKCLGWMGYKAFKNSFSPYA